MSDADASRERPSAELRLAALRVQDFRVLRDVCLDLGSDATVLIGENNTGKTAVLAALARAVGGAHASEDDLHVAADGSRASRFVVDVRLEPASGQDFDDDLAELLRAAVQAPDDRGAAFVNLRTTGTRSVEGTGLRLHREFVQGWSCDRAEADRLAAVRGMPVDQARRLIEFTLLDASRDLRAELQQRTSHWGRLLADLGMDEATRAGLEADLAALSDRIVAGSSLLAGVRAALERLTSALASGADAVAIAPLPPTVEELGRGMDVLVTAPASAALPLRVQGSGGRSLTSLLVFRAFVELLQGAGRTLRPQSIAGLEEPESHLHPHAQRVAFRQLLEFPGQKIVSTHSPAIAALADPRALRVLRRSGAAVEVRALGPACTDDTVTSLRRFVLRHHPDVLFARLVILVEGETEERALPVLARAHWAPDDPNGHGISIVAVAGAGHFVHVAPCLEALGIPWLLLADDDQAGRDAMASTNRALARDIAADPVHGFLLPDGTDFEGCLIDAGHRGLVEQVIADEHGETMLADRKARLHGQLRSKTATWDYESPDWEDRLAADYLRQHKGVLGELIAEALVTAGSSLPAVDAVFERATTILGGDP